MNAPLYEYGLIGEGTGLAVAVLLGLAFGFFLEQGGLGNARKLAGQFYLSDFTVLKVMFSAIVTAMLGLFWLGWLGVVDLSRVFVLPTYWLPQLAGGLVFGVGFVMGGLCPGTSCVALSSGRLDGAAVLGGMLLGIVGFNEAYPVLAGFYERGFLGQPTLDTVVGLSRGATVLAVVLLALASFVLAERIERRVRL